MSNSDDFVHGYCLDCGRQMPDKWMHKNPFAAEGAAPPCPSCGGVIAVIDSRRADHEITKNQTQRGVGRESRPTMHDWERAGEDYEVPTDREPAQLED